MSVINFRAYQAAAFFGACPYPVPIKDRVNGGSSYVSCGKCLRCRTLRQGSIVGRAHGQMIEQGGGTCLTLTINDQHMSEGWYDKRRWLSEIRNVFEKLEYHYPWRRSQGYIVCAELGEGTFRPHAHLLLFGLNLTLKRQRIDFKQWKYGHTLADVASPAAAKYIAGYLTDENKSKLRLHYARSNYLGMGRFNQWLEALLEESDRIGWHQQYYAWAPDFRGYESTRSYPMDRQMRELLDDASGLELAPNFTKSDELTERLGTSNIVQKQLIVRDQYEKGLSRKNEVDVSFGNSSVIELDGLRSKLR